MITQNDNREITRRAGESDVSITFRSNRFFTSGNDWYFSTREGVDQGPFESRIIAHDAIQKYSSLIIESKI